MINYTPNNQLNFDNFETPFDQELDSTNRWIVLAKQLPWDDLVRIYSKAMSKKMGRPGINPRAIIASLIVKHKLRLSDRETVQMIQENMYMQYFAGLSSFRTKPIFDPSLFVTIRKRIGAEQFDKMTKSLIRKVEGLSDHADDPTDPNHLNQKDVQDNEAQDLTQTPKKGLLKLDATVADQMIEFPTDLKLLHKSRLETERIIDYLYKRSSLKVKPRTYRRIAKKEYLRIAKQRRKTKRAIRAAIRKQLGYVHRNIKTIANLLSLFPFNPLSNRDIGLYETIKQAYEQQKFMHDNRVNRIDNRIINLYQPYVRPIKRGKDKVKTEFGAKLGVSESNGFSRINKLSWDAYNECNDLIGQVEAYKALYGYYPEMVLADRIYLTAKNRKWLKQRAIKHSGTPIGRPKKTSYYEKAKFKKTKRKRNHVEGKFGQAKNAYGLTRIRARKESTSESWIAAIFFIMNIVRWQKLTPAILWIIAQIMVLVAIFCPFYKTKLYRVSYQKANPLSL